MSELKKRVATSLTVITVLVVVLALRDKILINALVGILTAGLVWEWFALAGFSQKGLRLFIALASPILWFLLEEVVITHQWLLPGTYVLSLCGLGVLLWCGIAFPTVYDLFGFRNLAKHRFLSFLVGWLQIFLFHASLLLGIGLHLSTFGRSFWLLGFVWVVLMDVVGFYVGKRWGTSKIAPALSPSKSWEGFLAGLASIALFCPVVLSFYILPKPTLPYVIFLAVWVGLWSIIGDLWESYFKRVRGVKDSGHCLPGHGGLLDRLDGHLVGYFWWLQGAWWCQKALYLTA